MNLSSIKKRLAERKPFLIFDFVGEDGCLAVEQGDVKIPLTIQCSPPSLAWILETGLITSLILRYSESYKKTVEESGQQLKDGSLENRPEIASQILKEVSEKILKSDEEKISQISTIVQLGKEYLIRRAEYAWYGDREQRFKVRFVSQKDEADLLNEQVEDEALYVWVDNVNDLELVAVASQLVGAIPESGAIIANVPIQGDVVQENGNVEKEVVGSVPADKVATFPRNTRNIVVEDIP